MRQLTLWNTTLPSLLTALLIRLDARLVGPYFAMSEVLGGFGGAEAQWFHTNRQLRLAFVRRFAWPLLAAGTIALIEPEFSHLRGTTIGILTAVLLLWPIAFAGLPWGVSRRDWHLVALYLSVVAGFAIAGWLGAEIADWIRGEVAGQGLYRFLRDLLLPGVMLSILGVLAKSSLDHVQRTAGEVDETLD